MKDWKGGSASVFKTIGATGHADHERETNDYYATEPKATELLMKLEQFEGGYGSVLVAKVIYPKSSNKMDMT